MTRAEEKALSRYPVTLYESVANILMKRIAFTEGYQQAEKDVWDRIEKYLSNRNPTDYATVGWILKNIEEYKKKIMEEE